MRKVFSLLLSLTLLLCACGGEAPTESTPETTQPTETTTQPTEATEATTEPTETSSEPSGPVITDEVKAQMDAALQKNGFEGIVQLTHNGEVVYSSVSGNNDLGQPLTIESPMYIGSVSKQFCAAAILMLREQGKLALEDTLEKYFPEYTIGKDITIHHLLCMRSGITRDIIPMWLEGEQYLGQTKEENTAAFKEWVFAQPLAFETDSHWEYCNINYTLLSLIVEEVTGEDYQDFLRRNILEPLGMTHTGFTTEIPEHPEWGLTYDSVELIAQLPVAIQGAGNIISTAADMDLWMTGLSGGQVISEESYALMTTSHSPDLPGSMRYGYGLQADVRNGWGHGGNIGVYATNVYFNREFGYNLYINSNADANNSPYQLDVTQPSSKDLLRILFAAVDAAA